MNINDGNGTTPNIVPGWPPNTSPERYVVTRTLETPNAMAVLCCRTIGTGPIVKKGHILRIAGDIAELTDQGPSAYTNLLEGVERQRLRLHLDGTKTPPELVHMAWESLFPMILAS